MLSGARRVSFVSAEDLYKSYPHEDQRLPASARVALERAHLLLANQRGSGCSSRSNCRMRSSSRRGSGRHQSLDSGPTDMGRYHRSPTQQLEQAMSRLEIARAYGMRASERNRKKKQGARPKSTPQQQQQQKSLRRSLSAGGALYTEPIPEDIACHRDVGYMSKRRAAYLDGDDHEVRLHDWVRCSSMYHSDVSRDSQGSPVSGQDPVNPLFMSSTCISETISGVSDRVDRGVQTTMEIGGLYSKNGSSKADKKVQTEVPWRSVAIGQEDDKPTIAAPPLTNGNVARDYPSQYQRKGEDEPSVENPEEAELQKRVEELRKSVAAMRSEARMLELQTEERVLLKEMNALGGYLRNARNLLASLDKIAPLDASDEDPKAHSVDILQYRSVENFEAQVPEVQPSDEEESQKEIAVPDEQVGRQREVAVDEASEGVIKERGTVVDSRGLFQAGGEPLTCDEATTIQQTERDVLRSEEADSSDRGLPGLNVGAADLDTPRGHQGSAARGGSRSGSHEEDRDVGVRSVEERDGWEMGCNDVCAESPVNTATLELSDSEKENGVLRMSSAEIQPAPLAEGSDDFDLEEDTVDSFHEFDLSAFNGGANAGGEGSTEIVENPTPSSPFMTAVDDNGMIADMRVDEPAGQPPPVSSSRSGEAETNWMNAEEEFENDGDLSLEERSMQMMMRMHDDQVRECGDYMSDYMAARMRRDGASLATNEEGAPEEENEMSNSREADFEEDDQQVLMELESILEKEIVEVKGNAAEGEEFESAKLDMSPRTWRLDFDINEVEDCPANTVMNNNNNSSSSSSSNNNIDRHHHHHHHNNNNSIMDAESEELLAAQESNRESVSSRELSTRTDSDYIEEFVEEVMRTFQTNTPGFSSAFSAPVPWKVFVDIQVARKLNKDQSIFDRCIFEALNEAVSDTYRTCNRVLSINRSDDEDDGRYIALPPDEEWISDVKNKVLKAVNHRSMHSDAIGTILSQDVFYLHNSVMDLHDELEEVQKEQLFT